jgi:hypothetical protein
MDYEMLGHFICIYFTYVFLNLLGRARLGFVAEVFLFQSFLAPLRCTAHSVDALRIHTLVHQSHEYHAFLFYVL